MLSALVELLRKAVDAFSYICFAVMIMMAAVLATFLLVFAIEVLVEARRYRAPYQLLCPHRGVRAIVKLRALRAALSTSFSDEPVLHVRSCSLKATSSSCDQSCLTGLRNTHT